MMPPDPAPYAMQAAGQGRPQTIPFPVQRELRAWDIQTEGG